MNRLELRDDLLHLNARLRADPMLTEHMGQVHMLSAPA